jgi:hypothetical protein
VTTTPAQLLTAAADWLAEDPDRWGRQDYVDANGCRCALGAIALAADPSDEDGDPFRLTILHEVDPARRIAAQRAVAQLADHLVRDLGADQDITSPATVGEWNDRQPDPQRVIDALRAAAQVVAA